MAAPTPTEVRERIEAILATIPGITTVLDGTEDEITEDMLPAVRVVSQGATRERTNRQRLVSTRIYQIVRYEQLESTEPLPEQQPNIDAAEAVIDVIPDFFAEHAPRLELNHAPLPGVESTSEMTDSGGVLRQWRLAVFTGVRYELRVTTLRPVTP